MWWIIGLAVSPFVLFLLITILLYLPPVQRWAVGIATQYASEKTGMTISIDDVRVRFPLDVQLNGVKAFKQNDTLPQRRDTVLMAERAICNVELCPLFDKKVEIDILQLDSVQMNTTDFIADCRVKGKVGQLIIESHGIDLNRDTLMLNRALLDRANIDVELADTAAEDTVPSETRWKIRVADLGIKNSSVTVHLPVVKDSISGYVTSATSMMASMEELTAKDGYLDLEKNIYDILQFDWHGGALSYSDSFQPRVKGLDFNHININELNTGIDSLHYSENDIRMRVRAFNAKEQSGLTVNSLTGHVQIDSTSVHIPDLSALTPNSNIWAKVDMDFNAFADKKPGQLKANINASIGKQDIMLFAGNMPSALVKKWPNSPLILAGALQGNMNSCQLTGVTIAIPSYFRLHANGNVKNLSNPAWLTANMDIDANARNIAFLTGMLPQSVTDMVTIPSGITARGNVKVTHGDVYDAALTITEGRGRMTANAHFDSKAMSYNADINASAINIDHFVKGMNLGTFSGKVKAQGIGTDVLAKSTQIKADATIDHFVYDKYNLSGSKATVNLRNGICHAQVDAHNKLIDGTIAFDAIMQTKKVQATVSAEVLNVDMLGLRLTDVPLNIGGCAFVDIDTDMKDYYKVNGTLSNVSVTDTTKTYRPDDMDIDILTRKDTTYAVVGCGDLHLDVHAKSGYKALLSVTDKITKELGRQIDQRVIDEPSLRAKLPDAHIYLTMGHENPLARTMNRYGYKCSNLYMDMTSSPVTGLNGTIKGDTLIANDIQIDGLEMVVKSNEGAVRYNIIVENGPDNPQYTFKANIDGELEQNGTRAHLTIDDDKKRRGIDVSLAARMEPEGIRMNIDSSESIIGYKAFTVNNDNYITLGKDMRASAKINLIASDGTGAQIFTDDSNEDALQDITLSLYRLDLDNILKVLPYAPNVTGVMNGDFHFIMAKDKSYTLSNNVDFTNLAYEGCNMGNIGSEFVYMPQGDNGHYIDGILTKDDNEIGSIKGAYDTNANYLNATAELFNLPLDLVNGFIPDQILGLKGTGAGSLTIKGALDKLNINGTITPTDAKLISVPYGVSLAIEEKPIRIVGSHILFENFNLRANNANPITVNGSCDFTNTDHITMNMRFNGKDVLLVDAKETRRSEAYGKGYVNVMGAVTGDLDKLSIRGKIEVLSKTNLYYILRDSPITTDNRLKELVNFTDFTQEQEIQVAKPKPEGVDMRMDIVVNEGSHIICWINQNHTNYLDIIGHGDLRFIYAQEQMKMTGRYTISQGEMKYSLPVIPLKTFTISSDSYIEFTGDVMNPTLSITATETNRTSATTSSGDNKNVDFTCGVVLSKTLQDMGLEFIISAPNDNDMNSELQAMSLEERGKLAVTMLTTGMYLNTSNTSNITMNSALSSFLQQEINNIAGSALKTIDVQLGLENSTQADGSISTDYSFKFAKRFWNNRLSISIGGRISTGTQASGKTASFFDNVDIQYRLADNSNQYVGAFYKNNVYDYLEGYVDQYGVNYTWKRRLQRLKEIFPWVKEQGIILPASPQPMTIIPADSIESDNAVKVNFSNNEK